jgi:hypothetical protein
MNSIAAKCDGRDFCRSPGLILMDSGSSAASCEIVQSNDAGLV